MALARTLAVGLLGVDGYPVEVEADLAAGLPAFTVVGLPDTALSESRDRIRAAVVNSGFAWPARRITVGLSPASRPKRGTGFDLAIAAAVLSAAGSLPAERLDGRVLIGELGLDGRVRPVAGVLPAVLAAAGAGLERVVVAEANAGEAALVPGVAVDAIGSLRGLRALLLGEPPPVDGPPVTATPPADPIAGVPLPDLADVAGQQGPKWALEVSAAGGHHLYLHGPPGTGKTMLAERLPGLLPGLSSAQSLEVTAIHSVAGLLQPGQPLVRQPPLAAPHHSASVPALVGGGPGLARPGAVSLAHHGVLFLDEAPEFALGCLDALRQPLESGAVTLARAAGTVRYPARFTLVLAANPCPCPAAGGPDCTCSPHQRNRYQSRLSGPLLDRVDIRHEVRRPSRADLLAARGGEATAVVAARVTAARERAAEVFAGRGWQLPAHLPGRELRGDFRPAPGAADLLETALRRGLLSARGLDRTLRLAWTLALLAARSRPDAADVAGALGLRLGTTL